MPNPKPIGTKATGYAGPEDGPFACSRCSWFLGSRYCGHPQVIADPQLRKQELPQRGLFAIVAPGGCCKEFRPKTRVTDVPFEKAGL